MKFDLLHFGWFNLYQDLFFEGIVNLASELLYLAWDMCYIQNGDWRPEGGRKKFSDCDGSTFAYTGFLRRIHILLGKFEMLAIAPDMARSIIVAKMRIT